MTTTDLVPIHATVTYQPLPNQMDYRDEWIAVHTLLSPYLAMRYWKAEMVAIDDREQRVFYRQAELRDHAEEIGMWNLSGFNVRHAHEAWRAVVDEKLRSQLRTPPSVTAVLRNDGQERLYKNPSLIDIEEVQGKVNVVIKQLGEDLSLLRRLEPQWVDCEVWERAKEMREEADAERKSREEREVAERRRQEEEQRVAREEQEEERRVAKEREEADRREREAQRLREDAIELRVAGRRFDDALWEARRVAVREERLTRAERRQLRQAEQERERRANPATFADPVIQAQEKMEEALLEFRRRNPAIDDDDLVHCELEATWKAVWRDKHEQDDSDDVFERYETLERKLRLALEDFRFRDDDRSNEHTQGGR